MQATQFEAWDSLRRRPASDFGIVVTAEADEMVDNGTVMIHTAALLFSWDRATEARLAIQAAVQADLPDTTEADLSLGESIRGQHA